jgi:hypothetical protein
MDKYYKSKGKIVYKNDGWIILQIDNSIVNYYKVVIEKMIFKKISTPLYSAHCTILPAKHSGDYRNHKNWLKHQGEIIDFEYCSTIYTNKDFGPDKYFWLKIKTLPIVSQIRKEFGLDENLRWPLHCSIGVLGY